MLRWGTYAEMLRARVKGHAVRGARLKLGDGVEHIDAAFCRAHVGLGIALVHPREQLADEQRVPLHQRTERTRAGRGGARH